VNTPKANENNVPPFCAPWLDPESRWFSLPMYLTSRFEVALWGAFRGDRLLVASSSPWNRLEEQLSRVIIERCISKALLNTLRKDIMMRERVAPVSTLRDGILFDLVEAIEYWRAREVFYACATTSSSKPMLSIHRFIAGISRLPILELNSTVDKIKESVRRHFQAEISVEIGRDLLTADDIDDAVATNNPLHQSHAPATGRRARTKKQRKKVAKRRQNTTQKNSVSNNEQEEEASGDESDGNSPPMAQTDSNKRISFPNNGTPFVERNKNIVMCLSTLNDVINEVFRRVGLGLSSDDESDGGVGRPKIVVPKMKSKQEPETQTKKVPIAKSRTYSKNAPPPPETPPLQQKNQQQHSYLRQNLHLPKQKDSKETKTTQGCEANAPLCAQFSPRENEGNFLPFTAPLVPMDTFSSHFPEGFFVCNPPFQPNPWHVYQNSDVDDDVDEDGWSNRSSRFPTRESSILTEFFLEQELADAHRQERITASSTAASLASSTDKTNEDTLSISDKFFIAIDNCSEGQASDIASDIVSNVLSAEEFPALGIYPEELAGSQDLLDEDIPVPEESKANLDANAHTEEAIHDVHQGVVGRRSISPEAPATPSPRLSPILLSLDDLRDIRTGAKSVGAKEGFKSGGSSTVPSSLPNSPVTQTRRRLISSRSRENLRVKSFRDDHEFARSYRRNHIVEEDVTYRNVAAGTASAKAKVKRSVSSDRVDKATKQEMPLVSTSRKRGPPAEDICARSENEVELRDESQNSAAALSYRNVAAKSVKSVPVRSWNSIRDRNDSGFPPLAKSQSRELCARSETAIEQEGRHTWQDSRRSLPDNTEDIAVNGKDESTTITSAMSQRESEETLNLREERDNFRDMCLTLGAEVAKLKNQLAAQQGAAVYPAIDYSQQYAPHPPLFGVASFDRMPPFFRRGQAVGPMSDAGMHRGDYESQLSEDEELVGKMTFAENVRIVSSGQTLAGSDVSIDPTSIGQTLPVPGGLSAPLSKDAPDSGGLNGLHTRLTQDILKFVKSIDTQHRKLLKTRNVAVMRMTRLVNTLWPRAQVKLYGSHVTSLCLPSSDLDFVISLPAVHKRAPAVAPGVLEGRNAINETSQKLLARKLKGESWIDPRSMKVIERTVVPIIKVATKDTRARTIQLDISFDGPQHHGLEAVIMVKQIVEELPMIRPLVLILKQFLLDRGLLTAYTGGLSSYCLFLMVARYLQEQPSSWLDCGSLLMGFLDFYGNCFDPRCTGISVGRRQYFTRPNYVAVQGQPPGQHMWAGVPAGPAIIASPAPTGSTNEFYRRTSIPPRFQPYEGRMQQPSAQAPIEGPLDHSSNMPFTFDPLFVDDPLSSGNNVGRNAFRIFQVQRAFSDAHRALVASLEWDIHSTESGDLQENNDYPLLKCLLQSKDVFFEV